MPTTRPPLLPLFLLAPLCAVAHAQNDSAEPELEPVRGLTLNAAGALEGYTLISPLSSLNNYLVDMDGELVHTWETGHAPSGTYFLENGNILRCAIEPGNETFNGGGLCGRIQEIDWDGNVVWSYLLANEEQTQHHDIERLPNGNVLLITWEHRYREDAIEWGRDPDFVGEKGIWPDAVLEIRPTPPEGGEIVWEWHVWDHMIQDFDPERTNYGSVPDHPELVDANADHRELPPLSAEELEAERELEAEMRRLGYMGGDEEEDDAPRGGREGGADWLHTNGIGYIAEYDLIVLSTPQLNELWIIDHSTTTEQAAWHSGGRWGKGGDLLWRWGNPRTYGAGSDADRKLFYQHNPTFVAGEKEGELRLLVYNNGGGRSDGDYSTVEELILPFHPKTGFWREDGWPFGPEEPAWTFKKEGFFSSFISGAERLENGNTLVCEGASGRVLEVTRAGEVVWEYLNPYGGDAPRDPASGNAPTHALFRAVRIPADHPALAAHGL